MNPPLIILGGGVHGEACWLIAYIHRKRKLRLRICSHLFKIVGVIALIIWDNVKFQMNIDIKVISIYFINHMLLETNECEMIRTSCNLDLLGVGGVDGFCCKLIDLNNDPDAVCSASIFSS